MPVAAAIDDVLASWWTAFAYWGIEQEQAGKDTSELVVAAGLAAAPYLLRQRDWNTASYLLDRSRIRGISSPATAQALVPLLRRITEATGDAHLSALAAALRLVDPGEAETLLSRVYDQATTSGNHRLASSAAGDLATLLSDQGKLREALALIDQRIEHIRHARLGPWTQLSGQGQRLQILGWLGQHEQVLTDLAVLRARMADLRDHHAENENMYPWGVREPILGVGGLSAVALGLWTQALDLYNELAASQRQRGASLHEISCTRLNNYGPLLHLGRLTDADQLLRDCQEVFDSVGDITMLAKVYNARAMSEDMRGHLQDAVELERTALRLTYVNPNPRDIAIMHHNLAQYLSRTAGNPAEYHAHHLGAALLRHLIGDTHALAATLRALAGDLRRDIEYPDAPVLPTALPQVIGLVDAGDGIRFGDLLAALCPEPDTAERTLADLLATAATLPDQAADDTVDRHLTD